MSGLPDLAKRIPLHKVYRLNRPSSLSEPCGAAFVADVSCSLLSCTPVCGITSLAERRALDLGEAALPQPLFRPRLPILPGALGSNRRRLTLVFGDGRVANVGAVHLGRSLTFYATSAQPRTTLCDSAVWSRPLGQTPVWPWAER